MTRRTTLEDDLDTPEGIEWREVTDPAELTALAGQLIQDTERLLDLLAALTGWDRHFFTPIQAGETVH
jgi:hypothetical protein